MCLIFFSYNIHETYQMVLAANRDEFYDRPTKPLHFWEDAPHVLGGRDIQGNGTWLGITQAGRLAGITNFRDPATMNETARSRGLLVSEFLFGDKSPKRYLEHVRGMGQAYNGFNLLVGDRTELFYYSNKGREIQQITPGLYGLSNHLLDTPWPKVKKGKAAFKALLSGKETKYSSCPAQKQDAFFEDLFDMLGNRACPPDHELPDTGVGLTWERILSPRFVASETYGTRSSSVILVERTGRATFVERTFVPKGQEGFEHETRMFSFFAL